MDPFHNSFDAAEQSASTPVAPTQQSVSASPAVQAEASIPSKPLTQKRTRMDELKADGIVKPQIIADTLQPERGSLRPSTPTPGAAQEPSQPEPESVPMDTSESTALVSTTTPGKRKRGSNSYGLYDDDDMPRTVSPRRPRSMYTRGTSAWRGPKVTYNLAKRIVEEEMIPERPGKKRRTIVEFYESPEVVLFEPPPGPRRVELDGDAEMGESPAFGEREVAAPRPIKSVEQIRQAKEVREKRPMSAAKKAFLEELEKDEVRYLHVSIFQPVMLTRFRRWRSHRRRPRVPI